MWTSFSTGGPFFPRFLNLTTWYHLSAIPLSYTNIITSIWVAYLTWEPLSFLFDSLRPLPTIPWNKVSSSMYCSINVHQQFDFATHGNCQYTSLRRDPSSSMICSCSWSQSKNQRPSRMNCILHHIFWLNREITRGDCVQKFTPWHYNFHEPNSSVTWHLIWPPFPMRNSKYHKSNLAPHLTGK